MHSYLEGHPALIHAIKRLEQLNSDQFEIYYEHRTSLKIDSKDQEVESLARAEDSGIAIRLVKDHKLGFSFTTSLKKEAIDRAVETACEVSTLMPEDPYVSLYSFGSSVYPSVDNFDTQGTSLNASEKIKLAKHLEALCRKADSRIQSVRQASISEIISEVHLVDSNGEHIHHKSTGYTANISCKAEADGDSQMGGDFAFSNYLDSLPIDSVALSAAAYAVELLGAGAAPTMKCPAVLRNSVVADLLDFLSASFSMDEIEKGRSILAQKEGQMVFSEKVSLIDDGLLPGGAGTTPFDGEGIPSRKNVLVDGGFISGILCDHYYSKKKGREPTGSASRSIQAPPTISFSNLFLQPGRKKFESLFDGISKGILVTDLMGVHTANPVTGDFSLGASGILIEKGKLTRPVRGFAVAGNVLELFRRITDISNDLKFFGGIGSPSVRLSEISLGGA